MRGTVATANAWQAALLDGSPRAHKEPAAVTRLGVQAGARSLVLQLCLLSELGEKPDFLVGQQHSACRDFILHRLAPLRQQIHVLNGWAPGNRS